MNRFLLIAGFILLEFSAGLLQAEDILSGLGGFEQPTILKRATISQGGDPSVPVDQGLFSSFNHKPGNENGVFTAGLTNDIARTGFQSLFLEADKLSANFEGAGIQTHPIPVVSGTLYRATLWGRMDAKKPFVLSNRPVYFKMQIDFFGKDKETQIGDTVYLVQPIPGTKNRDPYFTEKKWAEVGTEFTTPEEAAYAVVTLRWETGTEAGDTSGIIYFDDLKFDGPMPPNSLQSTIKAAAAQEEAAPEPTAEEPVVSPEPAPENTQEKAPSAKPAEVARKPRK